jgi:ribosomal protein L11 methyltransferase
MDYIELNCQISPIQPFREILISDLADLGFESFVEQENGLQAYIQKDLFQEEWIKSLDYPEAEITFEWKLIEEENWNESWENSFEPVIVDDTCIVKAPFHQIDKIFDYEIIISPKMSFGTGHHQTTHMMIQTILSMELEGKTVLDMGTGTGVLAILCEKREAADILAIDIEDWAYHNAIENAEINSCEKISIQKGEVSLIQNLTFDIVLANINKNVLLTDMDAYCQSLKNGGDLILSGFFIHDNTELIEKAETLGLIFVSKTNKDEWSCLRFAKK